jgi:hypothetical protein
VIVLAGLSPCWRRGGRSLRHRCRLVVVRVRKVSIGSDTIQRFRRLRCLTGGSTSTSAECSCGYCSHNEVCAIGPEVGRRKDR